MKTINWRSFIAAFIAVLLGAATVTRAESPPRDFLTWYRDWLDRLPTCYAQVYRQYVNHPAGAPLEMSSIRWERGSHEIIATSNSELRRDYRFLRNPMYCATIDGLVGSNGEIVWNVTQFARREEDGFELAASWRHIGADPDFLGVRTGYLDGPHRVSPPVPDRSRPGISTIVINFFARDAKQPRLPRRMTVFLDDKNQGLPVEVVTEENGGARSRLTIDGWRREQNSWVFGEVRTFYQRRGTAREVLHNTQAWQFESSSPSRDEQCYLSFYGLAEPNDRAWPWRAVAFVSARVLLTGGDVVRNHGA